MGGYESELGSVDRALRNRALGRFATGGAVLAIAAIALAPNGCQRGLDPKGPFQMTMNGAPYTPKIQPAVGNLQVLESGFSIAQRVRIFFPLLAPGAGAIPGLEIEFDPEVIPVGEEVEILFAEADGGISITYFPLFGHRHNEGILLLYTPDAESPLNIRFDELEPRIGGRVSGSLIFTRLHGRYETMDGESIETEEPKTLEIRNFPFDVQLTESPY